MNDPARIDPTAAPAALSPTGTPKINPRSVPWLMIAAAGVAAGLEFCAHSVPAPWSMICQAGAVALSGALGIASPGLRSKP